MAAANFGTSKGQFYTRKGQTEEAYNGRSLGRIDQVERMHTPMTVAACVLGRPGMGSRTSSFLTGLRWLASLPLKVPHKQWQVSSHGRVCNTRGDISHGGP